MGGILFAVALNFKHLFLYLAPAYFVYLLRHYCISATVVNSFFRLSALGISVIFIFALSFGPFVILGQLPQVLARLFPFGRGLCHAYWAPNFWAVYNVVDKFAASALQALGMSVAVKKAAMTGGLVGDADVTHVVLPVIKPSYTIALILLSLLVCNQLL